MLFRVAILRALKKSDLSDADRRLMLRYAMFPRLRGTIDGKPCVVDVMEEAEAEMSKTALVQGRIQTVTSIDWNKLLDWLVQNLPKILELIMALVAAFGTHTEEEATP